MSITMTAQTRTFLAQAVEALSAEYLGLSDYQCIASGVAALVRKMERQNKRVRDLIAYEIEQKGIDETLNFAQQYADIEALEIDATQELVNLLATALFIDYEQAMEQAHEEWWDSLPDKGVDLSSIAREKEASRSIILTGEDNADWRCACGNAVYDGGFYPCDETGAFIRDADGTIDGPDYREITWDRTYKCLLCGQRWRFDPALNRQSQVPDESIGIVIGAL